jgi:hypothetical protein
MPILQSSCSLLIFKLMFKGFLIVSLLWVCFTLVHSSPSRYTPVPFYVPPPTFQQLSMHILISSTFTDVMLYNIVEFLSFFFFPCFPESHKVVPLLQQDLHMNL